jgi:hypothetical protein
MTKWEALMKHVYKVILSSIAILFVSLGQYYLTDIPGRVVFTAAMVIFLPSYLLAANWKKIKFRRSN